MTKKHWVVLHCVQLYQGKVSCHPAIKRPEWETRCSVNHWINVQTPQQEPYDILYLYI